MRAGTLPIWFCCIMTTILCCHGTGFCGAAAKTPILNDNDTLTRRIGYSLLIRNSSSEAIPFARFLVNGPHICNLGQSSVKIDTSPHSATTIDELDNQILVFSFDLFPPYGTKKIDVSAEVQFSPLGCAGGPVPPEDYLMTDIYTETDQPPLRELASALRGSNELDSVNNIFSWIVSNIEKASYSSQEKGALWALKNTRGDCSEFMHLFVSLCRILDIPARGVSGYKVNNDRYIRNIDFHDWAQFYIEGQWHIADPYFNVFRKEEHRYITIRLHGPTREETFFHRWQSEDPRLHISMNN